MPSTYKVKFIRSCSDVQATKAFYVEVFPSWEVGIVSGYLEIAISDDDSGGGPGGIAWEPGTSIPGWLPCVKVSNVNTKVTTWKNAGGSVITGPTVIGTYGTFAVVKDTTGGTLGLWQPA